MGTDLNTNVVFCARVWKPPGVIGCCSLPVCVCVCVCVKCDWFMVWLNAAYTPMHSPLLSLLLMSI